MMMDAVHDEGYISCVHEMQSRRYSLIEICNNANDLVATVTRESGYKVEERWREMVEPTFKKQLV